MANIRKDNKGRGLHTGEQQRKDGIYCYRYIDVTGKRQAIYAGDLPELRRKEKLLQKDLDDSILTDLSVKKMTLNDLFEKYMETKSLSDSTRKNYMNIWNNRVRDEFGYSKIIQLRASHVRTFYSKLSRAGYSHNTIKMIHNMLYPSLELAVEDDIIRKNPAKNALSSSYGTEAKEKDILTPEQQEKMLEFVAQNNTYKVYLPMLTVFLEVGLRCGELIGLTWDDISIEDKILSVNHQLVYKDYGDGYKFHGTFPKTEAGIRQIPLTDKVIRAFMEQKKLNFFLGRKSQDEIDGYSGFIFIAKTNRPYMPAGINSVLYHIVNAYNEAELTDAKKHHRRAQLLPRISAHCLRHTFCTYKARQGMNIKVLQHMMGHSDSSITLDVYNHLDNDADIRNEVMRCEKITAIS